MSLTARANRTIKKPEHKTTVKVSANASTRDIIDLIMDVDRDAFKDTVLFAKNFDSGNLYTLWKFVRDKIKYQPDPHSLEMVKDPSILWYLRVGDCKSFSIFIASILYNLGIPYSYRFVSYKKGKPYTHVYIVAHTMDGDIILDSVHHTFDDELPYFKKKDIKGVLKPSGISGILPGIGSNGVLLFLGLVIGIYSYKKAIA